MNNFVAAFSHRRGCHKHLFFISIL